MPARGVGRADGARRVLIADDSTLFADVLVFALRRSGLVARSVRPPEAGAAPSASAVVPTGERYDVVLVGGDAAPESVRARVEWARAQAPGATVLLLVADDGPAAGRTVRRSGADGSVSRHVHATALPAILSAPPTAAPAPGTGSAARAAGQGGAELTEREREVLDALAAGRTNDSVAELLGISPHTVRTHLQNIHSKLGVRRRLAAVTVARSAGLIAPRARGVAAERR